MGSEDWSYEEHDWLPEAATITFVRGLTQREIGDLLRVDWETERRLTFDEAEETQDHRRDAHPVQMAERDDWVVVVEPNGYFSTQIEIVEELSRNGEAVSVFRNVNAVMNFVVARDGVMVRAFDPLLFDDEEGDPLPEEEGLPLGSEDADPHALALELARRLTGVPIDRSWLLGTPRSTWLTAGPPERDDADGPPRPVLRIRRPADDGGRLRAIAIELNRVEWTRVRRGECTDLTLLPDSHQAVVARLGRSVSEPVDVHGVAGEVVELLVRRTPEGVALQRL
ncbi:DUF6461 domain-containing protein [Blastococcus sp. TF02A-26]|uniref:DUF6461 domain-containing protein n=1 Tax=Blastococcus sp. TF02A-26 TaxID=2250577 RepID=UPI000DEB6300|nr:DUF6461 domain-containing protein [Blastococcus sp. TF02A-26]RBY88481.1 hypothetical protein DQ240_06740 [Blastococcus sp. TF02A-26]